MKNLNRMEYIDSLRGIAALMVVWAHVSEEFLKLSPQVAAKGTALYDIAHDANFGRIGILLFFAISGFVIPASLVGGTRDGSAKFAIRRFFRLFPLFWVSILLAIVFFYIIPDRPLDSARVWANITMIPDFLDYKPLIGLYWTLALELIFYGICLMLFCLHAHNNIWVLSLLSGLFFSCLVLSVIGFDLRYFDFKIPPDIAYNCSFIGIMFWGAVYRHWWEKRGLVHGVLIFSLTLLVMSLGLHSLIHHVSSGGETIPTFVWSQLIPPLIFILGTSIIKVRHRLFSWVGEISYSLYLLHPVVFYSMFRALKHLQIQWLLELHLSVYIFVVTVLSLIVSVVTYKLVELPSINLGKKLSRQVEAKIHLNYGTERISS